MVRGPEVILQVCHQLASLTHPAQYAAEREQALSDPAATPAPHDELAARNTPALVPDTSLTPGQDHHEDAQGHIVAVTPD